MQERTRHPRRHSPSAERRASWWWRRRTRSSSRASIRCPKRSSTASCSSCWSPIRAREEERRIVAAPRRQQRPARPGRRWASAPVADAARARPRRSRRSRGDARWPTRWSTMSCALVRATRDSADLASGASPRAGVHAGRRRPRPRRAGRARLCACPTTSRRWRPRCCATACCCRPPPRSRARRSRTLVAGWSTRTEAPR